MSQRKSDDQIKAFNLEMASTSYKKMEKKFPEHKDAISRMIRQITPILMLIQEVFDIRHDMMALSPTAVAQSILESARDGNHSVDMNVNMDGLLQMLQPLEMGVDGTVQTNASFSQTLIEFMSELQDLFVFNNRRYAVTCESPSPLPSLFRPVPFPTDVASTASVSPGRRQRALRESVILLPRSPQSVPSSPVSGFMEVGPESSPPPPSIRLGVSYLVVIHGQALHGGKFAYKINPELRNVSYVVKIGQCPHTYPEPGLGIPGSVALTCDHHFASHDMAMGTILATNTAGETCEYYDDIQSIALQPLIFSIEPLIEEGDDRRRSIGLWRFDHWNNSMVTRTPIITWDQLVQIYRLDTGFCTYMFLFNLISKNLKDIKSSESHPGHQFSVNTVFHCCRTGFNDMPQIPLLELVSRPVRGSIFRREEDVYLPPPAATIVSGISSSHDVQMFVRHVTIQHVTMSPLLHRPGGLHVSTQGCLFNLLSYYGIIDGRSANIMTAMQSEGVTVRQFINLMQRHHPLDTRQYAYAVERLPVLDGLIKLMQNMVEMQAMYRTNSKDFSYALFIKLYTLNYKPGTEELSEIGHWVSFSIDGPEAGAAIAGSGNIPWRFVDPQGLSISHNPVTGYQTTTPMAAELLDDEAKIYARMNRLAQSYQAVDLIYVVRSSRDLPPAGFGPFFKITPRKMGGMRIKNKKKKTQHKTDKNKKNKNRMYKHARTKKAKK